MKTDTPARVLVALVVVTALAGCGLKGDLYLPAPPAGAENEAAAASPADDAEESPEDPAAGD